MPSNAAKLASAYDTEIAALLVVAGSGASASATREVTERLLESVFLNAVTATEAFIEELFLAAVTGAVRTGGTKPVIRFPDSNTALSIIVPPANRYVSWLPFSDTLGRAKAFLVDSLPFSRIDVREQLKSRLHEAMIVRNMIAHRSAYATAKFRNLVGNRYESAGQYLAATTGTDRVCEAFLGDFVRIANGLCAEDDSATNAILGDPDPIPSGARPGQGNYVCFGCGNSYVIARDSNAQLECSVCDLPCPRCGHVARRATFRRT
jgi:hypothetical protein